MAIKGDLWSMDLAQVLQMLSLNQKDGQLVIDLGDNRKKFVLFCRLGLTVLPIGDLNDESTLIHVIKRRNIAGGNVRDARKKYERFDKPLVEALKEVGLIQRSWLLPLLRERVHSQLLDLFFLTSGNFEFREGSANRYLADLDEDEREAFFFQVEEIVMEGSQRLDEWSGIRELVPTNEEIFCAARPAVALDAMRAGALSDEAGEVLGALDGVRDVNEVEEVTQLGIYKVCGIIADLLRDDYIGSVDPAMLQQTAHDLFQGGRLNESLRIFHRLCALTAGDPDVRLKIALIYERQGEFLKAAEQYRVLAEHYLREGAIVQSYEYYQTVLRLLPTDLDTLGRIIGLYLRYNAHCKLESFDVVEGGRTLVASYLEMKEIEKAVDLLQRLVKADVDVHTNRNQLIQLYVKHGRNDEAAGELDHIGKAMLHEGNRAGAVRIYRQILKLDPSRRDVVRLLDEIDEERRRTRSRRRHRFAFMRSSVYLSVFAACYLYYSDVAGRTLKAVDVQRFVEQNRFEPARRRLDDFVNRFPFSPAALQARELYESIETHQSEYHNRVEKQREELKQQERENLDRADQLMQQAEAALAKSDLQTALLLLQRAGHFAAAHPEWRREKGLDDKLRQLRDYYAEALKLRDEAENLFQNGKYTQCYEVCLKLFKTYGHATAAREIRAPILVESQPPGATVLVNDKPVGGITPLIVRLPLEGTTDVVFRREGYWDVKLTVAADRGRRASAVLPRRPRLTVQTDTPARSTPRIFDNMLVVGCRGGKVVAVDLDREMKLWSESFSGLNDKIACPVISEKGIFTGSVDPGLFRLESKDGRKAWHLRSSSYFTTAPVVTGKYVVACDDRGTVWCVWSESGTKAWSQPTGSLVPAPPAVAGGIIYVGTEDGDLIAYGLADGKERCRARLKGRIPISPLPHGDLLLVAAEGGMLYALERDTLEPRWTWPIDGRCGAPIVIYGDWAYLTIIDGRLQRFNLSTGKKDEHSFRAECNLKGAPLVRQDGVYLGGADGRFYVLGRRSLKVCWSFDLGSPVHASVLEWNNVVIVTTIDGTVFGFPPESER